MNCSVQLPTAYLQSALRHVLQEQGIDPDSKYELKSDLEHLWISSAFRIKVCPTEGEPIHIFMKTMPADPIQRETFELPRLFHNEAIMYNDFLSIDRELKIFQGAPHCYYASVGEEESVLVLEDLSVSGYKILDSIGYEELLLLMKEIGRFQALSFLLKAKQPERFNKVLDQLKPQGKMYKLMEKALSISSEITLEEVKMEFGETSECFQKYSKYVSRMSSLKELIFQENEEERDAYFVLAHCDLWVNNFMFRYSEGGSGPVSMKLLDYQGARHASLGLDVAYALLTVAEQEHRDRGWKELLEAYYNSLCSAGLGTVVTWDVLEREVAKGALYSLSLGVLYIAHKYDEEEEGSVATVCDDPLLAGLIAVLYRKTPHCKKVILDMVADCVKRGFLDGL